ncbi:uncharacterized protein [Hemitrygon akajei]|uniref:uncharacterized protein isoform X2 n=1 Tax=Hemitrygon akajei TaxID=2704970 RepID=UPI003BF9CCE4
MDDLDALLADLESTTSQISKRPIFIPEETPYSYPTGSHIYQEASMPPPVPPPPSADALNGIIIDSVEQWQPPISRYQQQQGYQEEVSPSTGIASSPKTYSTNVKSSSSFSQDSVSPPVPRSAEEDHVYSFPNKTKSSEPSPVVMTTSLGSNLSELDRLLLELNEVQHNPPSSFASDESNRSPHSTPVSSSQYTGQENGTQVGKKVPPPTKEKPKRNGGRGIEDVRPSVESLLDELESSVPSPSPATAASPVGGPASQRGTPNQQARMSASSATRELDELMESLSEFKVHGNAGTLTPISFEPGEKQKTSTPNILLVSAPVQSPISPPTSGVLLSVPSNTQFISNGTALPSPLSRTPSPLELLRIDEEPSTSQLYANTLSNHATSSLHHLVVHPSVDVNTKLDINVPPAVMLPILESPEPYTARLGDLQKTGSEKKSTENEILSCSSNTTKNISKSTLSSGSGQQEVDKSLIADFAEMNEALEKLLSLYPEAMPEDHLETKQQILDSTVMSVEKPLECPSATEFSSSELTRDGKLLYQQKFAAKFEGENSTELSSPNKMYEKPAEPMAQQHQKQGRELAVEQNNVNGCSEYLHPNEKRQKEKFDLPPVQIPPVERVSASRQMQSLIKRTKYSMNVHPMYREDLPRRKFGPVIFNKNVTQDRLIAELHGKLGIEKKEPKSKPVDDWLTEGLVITSKPVRKHEEGSHVVEKIIITPEPPSSKGSTPSPRSLSASPLMKECQDQKKTDLLKVALSPPLPVPSPPPLSASFLPPLPVPSPPPLPATFQPSHPKPSQRPHPKPPHVPLPMSSPPPLPAPSQPALPKPSQSPLPAPSETSLPKLSRPSPLLPSPSTASAPLYFKCLRSQSAPQWNISIDKSEKTPVLSTPHPASVLPLEYTSLTGHYPQSSSLPVVQTTAVQAEPLPSLSASPRVLVSIACQTDDEIGNEDSLLVRSQMMTQSGSKGKPGGPSTVTGPQKAGSQLDNMLDELHVGLNKLGVATVAKGVCAACKKPIAGQVVTAMGRTWHPEHFVCTHCQEEIGSRNFFERDGQPYCEKDYHNLFSPRCYYCNGPILDKVVTALDRTWHPEHFFCAQCGAFFGPDGFHEKDGKAYCRKDYFDMFAPKCGGCARAILENYISALNSLWHPECFVCRECFTPFINGSFFEHEGQPYCEMHYHERRNSLCSGCQKPITGRCITAMGKKFHPEHFVCAFCLKQLNKGTFKEQNDKPYCHNCFIKLFC